MCLWWQQYCLLPKKYAQKFTWLLEIRFCTAGVCNPTCFQHCRVAQIILPPQKYQGESSEPYHVYLVLMQEFVFHKMEFKLIQGLPFTPATMAQMSSPSPDTTQTCVKPDHGQGHLWRAFLHSPIHTALSFWSSFWSLSKLLWANLCSLDLTSWPLPTSLLEVT